MASPAVVGTPTESNATADDASPYTVSRPSPGVSGQLTIVIIAVDGNPTLTWPSGYTQFFTQSRAGGFTIYGAYHQEDGTEVTTFDITSDASEKWAAIVYSISGAANPASRAPEATTVDGSVATTDPDPPSITPTGGSKDYLFIAAINNDGEEADDDAWGNTSPTNYTPSPPRQKTSAVAGQPTTNVSLETAERQLTTAGPEDPGTFNNDLSKTYAGATIAVHPPAAPTPLTVGGTLTSSGALQKQTNKPLAGTATSSGALQRQANKRLLGKLTAPAGIRTRYQTSGVSDCVPAQIPANNRKLESGPVIGPTSLPGSVPGLAVDYISHAFTTDPGDPDEENLPSTSGVFRVQLNVTAAGANLTYKVRLIAIGGACEELATVDQTEGVFSGTGLKLATFVWDPPQAYRYQFLVLVTNDQASAQTLTLSVDNTDAWVEFPEAPGQVSGALLKQTNKDLSGTLTSSGILAVLRTVLLSLVGTLTSAGTLIRQTLKDLSGSMASSGALTKQTQKPFTGDLASTGTIQKQTNKPLAGTLSSSGVLQSLLTKLLNIGGTLTSAGTLVKQTLKALAGTLSSSGTLTKQTSRALDGTLSSSGTVAKETQKPLVGTLASSGAIQKQTNKVVGGTLTSSGVLTALKTVLLTVGGTLTFAGALVKQTAKSLAGALSSAGSLVVERIAGPGGGGTTHNWWRRRKA